MLKRTLLTTVVYLLLLGITIGQVQFTQRFEVESHWADDDFYVLPTERGVVGFRMKAENAYGRKDRFQYFTADFQLSAEKPLERELDDFYELVGFDLDRDLLYVLFNKGSQYDDEKAIFEIDIDSRKLKELELTSILEMELQDFWFLTKRLFLWESTITAL